MSRRAVVAEYQLCQGRTTLLAGIPSVQEHGNLIDPLGHVGISASGEHYDRLLVGRCDFLDQFILTRG